MNKIYSLPKILITIASVVTIVLPSIMDLNDTHMTNPLWAPHARFHWSIQWYSITILNGIALFLLWGRFRDQGSRLAVVMAGIAPFSSIAPNVIVAALMSFMSIIAIVLDGHLRAAHDSSTNARERLGRNAEI